MCSDRESGIEGPLWDHPTSRVFPSTARGQWHLQSSFTITAAEPRRTYTPLPFDLCASPGGRHSKGVETLQLRFAGHPWSRCTWVAAHGMFLSQKSWM